MNKQTANSFPTQQDLFETDTRSLLDQLLLESRLYRGSKDYKELLDFVVRLRNFAPFNAMLLQIQKPGLSYAASARDWSERFCRYPKEGARPLLILWPFGPIALVYDVMDTYGDELPEDVESFPVEGSVEPSKLQEFEKLLTRKNIECFKLDAGDRRAGWIRVLRQAAHDDEATQYQVAINRNHGPAVRFTTLIHELGHLFLGHLGTDKKLKIPERTRVTDGEKELEAESVAYIVCRRNGVNPKSQTYLSTFIKNETTVAEIDVYQVMRAAGQVETILGLASGARFSRPT